MNACSPDVSEQFAVVSSLWWLSAFKKEEFEQREKLADVKSDKERSAGEEERNLLSDTSSHVEMKKSDHFLLQPNEEL